MQILAFNGSPRHNGNTSTIIRAILEGAQSAGAETTEVRLHDINMKGCMGCLSCRDKHGVCAQKDDLRPYLEAIKASAGIVIGCPIYMYRVAGQMKLFVDRCYSLFPPKEGGRLRHGRACRQSIRPGGFPGSSRPGSVQAVRSMAGRDDRRGNGDGRSGPYRTLQ